MITRSLRGASLLFSRSRRAVRTVVAAIAAALMLAASAASPAAAASTAPSRYLEFSIVSGSPSGFKGHSFLMIKNVSSTSYKILGFTLKAGKIMTIGTFGNKSDGKGVYLNLEAYKNYATDRSFTVRIPAGWRGDIEKEVKVRNYWSCPTNCSSFAASVWNKIITTTKWRVNAGSPINRPLALEKSIAAIPGNVKNLDIPGRAKENVRRLWPDGTLTVASAKTLKAGSSGDISYCFS